MESVGWKIYRADGSVYCSRDTAIEDVPDLIQIVVIFYQKPYRDYFYGHDTYEVEGRMFTGVWMDTDAFIALVTSSYADQEWP